MAEKLSCINPLSVITANKIREIIISGKMKPGDRLPSEGELINMFGVSRSTVRESMKILKAENIVQIHRGKGTFISDELGISQDPLGLDFTDQAHLLENLLETRLIIEPQITFLAAQRATQKDIRHLEEIIERMKHTTKPEEENTDLDIEFHTSVAKCSQNDVLYRVVPIINKSIKEGYKRTGYIPSNFKKALESHINIFKAIKDKDAMTAKYESEKHIRQTLKDLK